MADHFKNLIDTQKKHIKLAQNYHMASTTGFSELDNLIQGFFPGELIVLSGMPGTGKSILAMNLAENTSYDAQKPVLFFNLEQTEISLMNRMSASLSGVNHQLIRSGNLNEDEQENLNEALNLSSQHLNMYIDSTLHSNTATITNEINQQNSNNDGISLVIVDSLQMLKPQQKLIKNNESLINSLYKFKSIARDLNIPVLLVVPEIIKNDDYQIATHLTHLADCILAIKAVKNGSYVQVYVIKQRHGMLGSFQLEFEKRHCRFCNCQTQIGRDLDDDAEKAPKKIQNSEEDLALETNSNEDANTSVDEHDQENELDIATDDEPDTPDSDINDLEIKEPPLDIDEIESLANEDDNTEPEPEPEFIEEETIDEEDSDITNNIDEEQDLDTQTEKEEINDNDIPDKQEQTESVDEFNELDELDDLDNLDLSDLGEDITDDVLEEKK